MININLLPPQIKEDILYSKRNAVLKKILNKIIFLLIFFILVFSITYILLLNKINLLQVDTRKEEENLKSFGSLEENAGKLKEKLDQIKKIEEEYPHWTTFLDELYSKMPSDIIYMSEITASKEESDRIEIKGSSTTKQSIANFRKALEESDKFENIDIETIAQGEQEEVFFIKLSLKKNVLK